MEDKLTSWKEFQEKSPEIAKFGAERLRNTVAYLGTVSKGGQPRVHPVSPIVGGGHLFLFMDQTSPKAHDLQKNGRYALHSSVRDTSGSNGEFAISGHATLINDAELRATAARTRGEWYKPKESYVLFELTIERATTTTYLNEGPVRKRWKSSGP